jgi:hypothetical protein
MLLLYVTPLARREPMLPACRTEGDGFAIPTFEVFPSDVEGFMDELRTFQSGWCQDNCVKFSVLG